MASSSGRGDEAAIHYETTVRDNAGHLMNANFQM
jgi:hypothetical protein